MNRDEFYLEHIIECIDRIVAFSEADRERFFGEPIVQDAILRNLQVLAESTTRISDELILKHPEVSWRELRAFRNILVHDYFGLDLEQIWSIIEQDVPTLRSSITN